MDPIANMLTSIRNAQAVKSPRTAVPYSRFRESLAKTLQEYGWLAAVRVQEGKQSKIVLTLTYDDAGLPQIKGIKRLSRPGQRRYATGRDIPYSLDGVGSVIVSTSQGLMNDKKARELGIGGELICEIW